MSTLRISPHYSQTMPYFLRRRGYYSYPSPFPISKTHSLVEQVERHMRSQHGTGLGFPLATATPPQDPYCGLRTSLPACPHLTYLESLSVLPHKAEVTLKMG